MLYLPEVTLVLIETRQHELGKLALEECLSRVNFYETLVFTDKPSSFLALEHNLSCIQVPDWETKLGYSQFSWYGAHPYVHSTHFLLIQWDSWVLDPLMWKDEYLSYDYIGSPWLDTKDYTRGKPYRGEVGNGGFSLRSARLHSHLPENRESFPCFSDVDDCLLCCGYRRDLEAVGFKWAPEALAQDFAFEAFKPRPDSRHFGFHGVYNFPLVLDREALVERIKIASRDPYITGHNRMWPRLLEREPWLKQCLDGLTISASG